MSLVFQPMGIFIEAIKQIAALDMLLYVPSGVDTSSAAVADHERVLSNYWNADLHLFLCPRAPARDSRSKST